MYSYITYVRIFFSILILSLLSTVVFAQNIAVINGKPLSSKEFMWVYKKNHNGIAKASYTDILNYLNLYINFKLKVLDARANKLDADTAYLAEIASYQNALEGQKKQNKKLPDYEFLINEYREGVLMFNISEQKIWNKSQENEDDLHNFYISHKNKYNDESFDKARGQIVSDYQQDLENKWINTLRGKYPVKIIENEVKKLAKL